jgi:hypothetical protein
MGESAISSKMSKRSAVPSHTPTNGTLQEHTDLLRCAATVSSSAARGLRETGERRILMGSFQSTDRGLLTFLANLGLRTEPNCDIQPKWNGLIRIALTFEGTPINHSSLQSFQRERLGRTTETT